MATDSVDRVAPGDAWHPVFPENEVGRCLRTLLARLPWPNGEDGPGGLRTVGLTSCRRGEGVSTVASQLAVIAAATGRRVVLVDANPDQPSVHQVFPVELRPGLVEALSGAVSLSAAIRPSGVPGMSVIAAGQVQGNAGEVFDSHTLGDVVRNLSADFDLAVFDLPAAAESGPAVRLAALLDGVVLVVEAERVRWEVAQRTSELLRRGNVHLLGAVLNKRRQHVPDWLYRTL
jgi:succinoglycan biosynthesis transport protein ExoP